MSFLQRNFGNAEVLSRRGMLSKHCIGREAVTGDEFGSAIRLRNERRNVRQSISWRPAAAVALLASLALTAACGTSVKAPSEEGTQATLGSAKPAEKVADSKVYRSEEHTSELQSRQQLVCRLRLEKKQQQP